MRTPSRRSTILLFCGISTEASSAELIGKFTGSGSGETAEFEVQAPWLLDWRVNSDYPQMLGIEVSLQNDLPRAEEELEIFFDQWLNYGGIFDHDDSATVTFGFWKSGPTVAQPVSSNVTMRTNHTVANKKYLPNACIISS